MRRRKRFSRLDRIWQQAGCSIAIATGPAAMPSADAVRRVLREFAALDPKSRLLRRVDLPESRWLYVGAEQRDEFVSGLVAEFDDSPAAIGDPVRDDGPLLARLVALSETSLGDLPFRLSVGRQYCVLEFPHLLSDRSMFVFWVGVLRHALEDGSPADLVETGAPLPLARALTGLALRRPGRLPALTRRMRTTMRQANQLPGAELPAAQLPGAQEAPAVSGPVGRVLARSGPDLSRTLRGWRDEHAPGVSLHAVLCAAAAAAADQCGLVPAPHGSWMPCDLRRYLKSGAPVYGNFAAASLLRPADPASPGDIAAELRSALELGEPLVALALSLLSRGPSRRRAADPAQPAPKVISPLVRNVFTGWGELPGLNRLPWLTPPEDRFICCIVSESNLSGVSYTYTLLDGVLHVWAHFDEHRYEAAAIRETLKLLCTDPVAVLAAHAADLRSKR